MEANHEWRQNIGQRQIQDIWLAIKMTGSIFAQTTLTGITFSIILSWMVFSNLLPKILLLSIPAILLISFWFIFRVWQTYYQGIVVDAERSELSFPATDVENRLIDIITLKRFFDHARRETLRLASIESVMNETRARRGHFAVNISGSFGSRQFSFDSKQKRDEFRTAIAWGIRETGVRLRQDSNVDVGGFGA